MICCIWYVRSLNRVIREGFIEKAILEYKAEGSKSRFCVFLGREILGRGHKANVLSWNVFSLLEK